MSEQAGRNQTPAPEILQIGLTTLPRELAALTIAALSAVAVVWLVIGLVDQQAYVLQFITAIAIVGFLVYGYGYQRLRLLRRSLIVEAGSETVVVRWMSNGVERRRREFDRAHLLNVFYQEYPTTRRMRNHWLFIRTTTGVESLEKIISGPRPRWRTACEQLKAFLHLPNERAASAPLPRATLGRSS
jgi:hypothetical protein